MRLQGYGTWRQDVILRAGQRVGFNENLQEYRLASLDARSLKPDAEVFLRGSLRGKGGQILEDIEPGFYDIEVREAGTRPWKDLVNLQPGEPWKLLLPMNRGFNVGIFPGRLTGQYINSVDRKYGTRTSAEWALQGVSDGLARLAAFNVVFSHYDGFPVAKKVLKDVRDETWKGLVFSEINTAFLRKKAKELDLDAILLLAVAVPGDSGPYELYVFDAQNDHLYRVRGTWRSGSMTPQIATATEDVLRQFLKAVR
jgi:hypothetical protein